MMKNIAVTTLILLAFLLRSTASSAQEPEANASEEKPRDIETKLPMGPLLLGGFGLAAAAAGAGFAWQAHEENDDYNTEINGAYPFASDELADDIKTHAIVADVLMFGGGAVVLGSLLWWLFDDDYDTKTKGKVEISAAKWRPLLGPGQAGLSVEF